MFDISSSTRAGRRHRGRQHEVDAEGPALDPVTDPVDVGLDLLGGVHRLTQHGEATTVDHRHRNVLAVGERDHRVLDAQHVAELGVQRISSSSVLLAMLVRALLEGALLSPPAGAGSATA